MAAHVSMSDSLRVSSAVHQSDVYGEAGNTYSRQGGRRPKSSADGLSCGKQVLLAAASYGPEASVSFEAVYSVLSLQYLGVPVSLVSLNGVICGLTSMVLIPTMGSFADKGPNLKRRRTMSLLLGLSLFVAGFWILAIASGLKARSLSGIIHNQVNAGQYGSLEIDVDVHRKNQTWLNETTISTLPAMDDSATTYSSDQYDSNGDSLSTTGILGILGFTCLDIGFDASMSQIRTFLMDNVPEHQNANILVTSTLVTSFGGILNTFLGMFDLPSLLGPMLRMDGVAATLICVCVGISTLTIIAYVTSFISGHLLSTRYDKYDEKRYLLADEKPGKYHNISNRSTDAKAGLNSTYDTEQANNYLEQTKKDGRVTNPYSRVETQQEMSNVEDQTRTRGNEETFFSQWKFVLNKRLLLVFTTAFFSFGCLSLVSIYFSNTLTIAVVKGDPHALPGTQGKSLYEQGLRNASTGVLLSYLTYLGYSLIHKHLQDLCGPRLLYLLANVFLCTTCILFCLVQTVSTFYVFMAFYGPYRCCNYTLPFLLCTTFSKRKGKGNDPRTDTKDENLAKVMSLLGFLFTSNYLMLSCVLGPLMDATGSAWPPAYFLIGSSAFTVLPLGILLFL